MARVKIRRPYLLLLLDFASASGRRKDALAPKAQTSITSSHANDTKCRIIVNFVKTKLTKLGLRRNKSC